MASNRRESLPQEVYYGIVALICLLVSIGSLLVAVLVTHEKEDAGRGGALAICIALGVLFLRQGYGEKVYLYVIELSPSIERKLTEIPEGQDPEDFTFGEVSTVLRGMIGRMNVEADEQNDQNKWLFCATLIGTIFAAFGDRFFRVLSAYLCHHP